MGLGPSDLQLAIALREIAQGDDDHADHIAVGAEVDCIAFGRRIHLGENLRGDYAQVAHVAFRVVRVLVDSTPASLIAVAYAACSGCSDSSERSKPASSIETGGAFPAGGAR